ncbi:hypothetical protein IV102_16110 [bacterium]|nr:hypothetical protein [bacterium]
MGDKSQGPVPQRASIHFGEGLVDQAEGQSGKAAGDRAYGGAQQRVAYQ